MTKVTFTGENASGYVEYWGYRFPCGEEVSVEGEAVEAAKRHPEFTVAEETPAKAEYPPAESEKADRPVLTLPPSISKPKTRRPRRKKA